MAGRNVSTGLERVRNGALITGSLISIWFALILLIIAAQFFGALFSAEIKLAFDLDSVIMSAAILAGILGVVAGWFNNLLGGWLMIIGAAGIIYGGLDDLHLGKWPQYILLLSGVVLLTCDYIKKYARPT